MRSFEIVDLATVQRADGDEVQRRIVSLENLFEPRRAILNHESSVEAAVSAAEEEFSCPRAQRAPLHPISRSNETNRRPARFAPIDCKAPPQLSSLRRDR